MFRISSFLLTAVLSSSLVLVTYGTAGAQFRGGGGNRSGGHYSGGGGQHYRSGGQNYSGGGLQFSIGGYPRGGSYFGGSGYYGGRHYGSGYPGQSVYRSSGYYSPSYSGSGRYSNYYAPSYPSVVQSYQAPTYTPEYAEVAPASYVAPAVSSPTRIEVILPDPQAITWIDGLKIDNPSRTQGIEFPSETAGKTYPHQLKAQFLRDGKLVTEERQIQVAGGSKTVVDFTRKEDSATKAPPIPEQEDR